MYGLRYLIEKVYELKGFRGRAALSLSQLIVGIFLTVLLGVYSQVSTAQSREIRVISSSTSNLEEQNAFIQTSLTAVDASLVFAGYCSVDDATPDPVDNNAWLAVEAGTIFGKEVEELDFLVGNGSDFEVLTVDAVSKGVVVMPQEFSSSLSGISHDYSSENVGLATTSGQATNYAYSVIPGQQRDSITVVDEGNENYSVMSSGTSALLSAVYEKPGSTTDPDRTELTVLNQRSGNNVKVINQPYIESVVPEVTDTLINFGTDADYFVSSSEGNDSNDGLSPDRPKKTLSAALSLVKTGVGGQKLALKASDVWYEQIKPNKQGVSGNHIVFGAYGVGKRPRLDGTVTISNWSVYKGSIYKASVSSAIGQLFVDGERIRMARYPNDGFHTISTISSTTLTSSDLSTSMNYTGAAIIVRNVEWALEAATVTSSSGQSITMSKSIGTLEAGEGFMLVNKLEFLDEANEWFYDKNSQTVYVWMPDSSNPANHQMSGSLNSNAINTWNCSNLTIENLDLFGSGYGVYITKGSGIDVVGCEIHGMKYSGIYVPKDGSGQQSLTFDDNVVYDCSDRGIRNDGGSSSTTITNNQIYDIGLFDMLNNDSKYAVGIGISSGGDDLVIEYNDIRRTGYSGISLKGINAKCRYNYVEDALLWLSDGGCIYTIGTEADGTVISNNVVRRAYGGKEGIIPSYTISGGVYLDDLSTNVTVKDNTIYDCNYGIYFHNDYTCYGQGNLIVHCGIGIYAHEQHAKSYASNNTIIVGDVLQEYSGPWLYGHPHGAMINGATPSLTNNTYYCQSATKIFKTSGGGASIDFSSWKSSTGNDTGGSFSGSFTGTESLFYNETANSKTVSLSGTWKTIDGTAVSSLILAPYTGKVLLKTD